MTVKLICVGRLKEKFYGDACAEFKKRISRFADVNIIEVEGKLELNFPKAFNLATNIYFRTDLTKCFDDNKRRAKSPA